MLIDLFIITYLLVAWCWRAQGGTFWHAIVRPVA